MILTNSRWLAPIAMILMFIVLLIVGIIRFIAMMILVTYETIKYFFLCHRNKYPHLSKARYRNNKFKNPWESYERTGSFLRPVLVLWDFHKVKKVKPINVQEINYSNLKSYFEKSNIQTKIQYTWIGHASALIQCDGFNILTDPMFSDRCSPVQWFGPKRFTPTPEGVWNPDNWPPIDIVLISHDHHDHLDYNTIKFLLENNKVRYWCVPLGVAEWLLKYFKISKERMIERDWYQSSKKVVNTINSNYENYKKNEIELVCMPCQHFAGRTLFDFCSRLWCSWVIRTNNHKIFFAGDTGYRSVPRAISSDDSYCKFDEDSNSEINSLPVCPVFKEAGSLYDGFDFCMLPIGAYSPRWFNSYMHFNPYDACCAHKDLKSKKSVGIHWGTFVLTDENVQEPPILLEKMKKETNIDDDEFIVVDCGQTISI